MKIRLTILLFTFIVSAALAQYRSVWDGVGEEVRNKNSFKRYEWFYKPRTDEFGTYPVAHVKKEMQLDADRVQAATLNKPASTNTASWTNIGPAGINMSSSFIPYWGEVSGRIRGVAVHPTDPNIVYVGAAAGGIWKTTNGGTTWTDKSAGMSRITFGSIAIDPSNTNTIYAGTGEARWLFNNVTYEGDGLYKSTDGGSSWTQITNGFGTFTQFSDITVHPSNSNVVLASLGSGNWNNGFPPNEGIWRSSDAGTTWSRVLNVPDGFDVAFDPTDGSKAYAASGNKESTAGFYRSTDAGATWVQSNTGLAATAQIGRIQFEVSPSTPSTIYSIVYNNVSSFSGSRRTAVFKSTDSGVNWAQIASGSNVAGTYDGTNVSDQGSYDLTIAVHPTNASIVVLGNVEISRSTNGSTFGFVRNPSGYQSGTTAWDNYAHTDVHKIVFAPSNGNIAYLGCDGGVYKTTDAGATWFSVNNAINTIQFYRLASHPTNASILYGGAQDNGNFSTTNKGATAWVFETSGDGMECFVDYSDPNYVYMSTQNGSLYRSTDAGVNWLNATSLSSNTAWVAPYWQHPTTPATLYAALSQKIYRSTDRGVNWSAISSAITTNLITDVSHSKVNTNKMVAVASNYTTNPSVYTSTDGGVTWTDRTAAVTGSGFTGTNMQRVACDPVNENTIYVTRASYGTGQVIKSTDFGVTWSNASGTASNTLPAVTVNDLFIDPANANHLYAASDFGVYWSPDAGTTWTKLATGMPTVPVMDFSFFSFNNTRFLRAATHGRGVYELQINEPLPVELTSFAARSEQGNVVIEWETATEINNYGFEIERSSDRKTFEKIGFVSGAGNSNTTISYSFTDTKGSGVLLYRLKQLDTDGTFSYSDPVEIDHIAPMDFEIFSNYPNPFNPSTTFKFKVPVTSRVTISIHNALGEQLEVLPTITLERGVHEHSWNASAYASGVYFASINIVPETGADAVTKNLKMILSK